MQLEYFKVKWRQHHTVYRGSNFQLAQHHKKILSRYIMHVKAGKLMQNSLNMKKYCLVI